MIDTKKLQQAYDCDSIYSLQLEVGDICYQGCIYCYMNAIPETKNSLTDQVVFSILKDARRLGVTSIEWLGGEPLLRPSIFQYMEMAESLGLRNNIWTGGLPLKDDSVAKNCARYGKNGLIAVHVSSVDEKVYKLLHPARPVEDLKSILNGVRRLLDLGYPPEQMLNSVTYTGLQGPEDMIQTIDYFEQEFGIATSLNVYHTYLRPGTPVGELERFIPSRKDVAKVYGRYTRQYGKKRLPMNCVNKQYCSANIAVLCDGSVAPCATIREKNAPNLYRDGSLYDIFQTHRDYLIFKQLKSGELISEDCKKCKINDQCWGCRSRAFAAGLGIYGKDPRCFTQIAGERNK
jgi:radical SAM protein with 4Fe4S-binding SPASM domain